MCYASQILLVLASNQVQNDRKLVSLAYYVHILLSTLLHLLARWQRKAARALKQKSLVDWLWCFVRIRALQHFREHATDGPHIDGIVIVFLNKYDLRRSVPSANDMVGQTPLLLLASFLLLPLDSTNLGFLVFNIPYTRLFLRVEDSLVGENDFFLRDHLRRNECLNCHFLGSDAI